MQTLYKIFLVVVIAGGVLYAPTILAAVEVPTAPPVDRAVVDQTGTLTDEQVAVLSQKLRTARQEKNIEMAILMVSTLEGRAIEDYSLDVARTWGVGERDKDNGVLLVIAKDDRLLRIEVGRGQEGDFTDAQAGRVLRNTLAPAFKREAYYEGLDSAASQIIAAASGRTDAIQESSEQVSTLDVVMTAAFFAIPGLSWLASILGRTKSWWAGGLIGGVGGSMLLLAFGGIFWTFAALIALILLGLGFDYLVSKNYKQALREHHSPSWWAGGPFIGGGGGSGGFGGGGFGGGGASGSW